MTREMTEKLVMQDLRNDVLDLQEAARKGLITPEYKTRIELYRDLLSGLIDSTVARKEKELA